jgi:hypothetical protein
MSFFVCFNRGPSLRASIALGVALLAVIGCSGPRDERYNPRHFHVSGTMLPAGVMGPTSGIYAVPVGKRGVGDTIGPVECCVVARRAQFRVAKTASESVLHVWVHVGEKTHVIAVAFPGFGQTSGSRHLVSGDDVDISFNAPTRLKRANGLIPVQLDCAETDRASHDPCAVTSVYFE